MLIKAHGGCWTFSLHLRPAGFPTCNDNKRRVFPADLHLNFVVKQHRPVPVFIGGLLETWCPVNHNVLLLKLMYLSTSTLSVWSPLCATLTFTLDPTEKSFKLSSIYFFLSGAVPAYFRKYWKHLVTKSVHFIALFVWALLLDISLMSWVIATAWKCLHCWSLLPVYWNTSLLTIPSL